MPMHSKRNALSQISRVQIEHPAWAEEKIASVIVPLLRRHGVEVG